MTTGFASSSVRTSTLSNKNTPSLLQHQPRLEKKKNKKKFRSIDKEIDQIFKMLLFIVVNKLSYTNLVRRHATYTERNKHIN